MSEAKTTQGKLAAIAVRLAALWLLTGALFKLFAGNPKMLPEFVREHSPFSWTLTFQLAIAIELAIVCAAVLKPHWGWMWITAIFGVFLVLLTDMIVKGAASCGCLGEKVTMPPSAMMAIDAGLLAFVLFSKPWRSLSPPGLSTPLLVLGVLASIAAPWIVVRPIEAKLPLPLSGTDALVGSQAPTTTPSNVYITLEPEKWAGQVIYDVEQFTRVVATDKIPSDGRIVLWRQSCDHCAKHLREMANEKNVTTPILLVQVMDDLKNTRSVDAMPTGGNVTEVQLPPGEGMFTTPVEIRVEGGVVKAVLYEEDLDKERAR